MRVSPAKSVDTFCRDEAVGEVSLAGEVDPAERSATEQRDQFKPGEPVPHDRELVKRPPEAVRGRRIGVVQLGEEFGPLQLGIRRKRLGQIPDRSDVFRINRSDGGDWEGGK